jgi:tetratricopeptide (TPR) repeat protein
MNDQTNAGGDPTIASKASSKPNLAPLRDRASRTMKVLWTGVGALATLGGVMGLFQVLSAGSTASSKANASSQDVLMEMVKSGDIEVADAERLAELLYGENGGATAEGLQDIAQTGTDRQREALSLLAERHTRKAGLDLLEAEATTGADWRLIAELAIASDPKRALVAVKKAIALDPEDFRAVTLMSQVQARTGDYASAQRTSKTAELLATTERERLMSARASLNILVTGRNVSEIPDGILRVTTALTAYAPIVETTPLPVRFETTQAAENHPLWLQASSNEAMATASLYTNEVEAALRYAELAILDFEQIAKRVPSQDIPKVKRRIAGSYNNQVYVKYAEKDWPEVMRLAKAQLDIYREIAESGDKAGQAALPGHFSRYASYATYASEPDIVRSASRRAVDLARRAADRRPDDIDLALDLVQIEFGQVISLVSIGDDVDLQGSLDKMMTALEDSLRGQPDNAENSPWNRYTASLVQLVAISRQDEFKALSELNDGLLERAEKFLDQEILSRPEAHDPRHARNGLYITIGDLQNNDGDIEAARDSYALASEDAVDIPPTQDEPDVVELTKLVALQRIVALEEVGVEPKDRPELQQAIELATRLDKAGKLTTGYQSILSYLIAIRDDTMPESLTQTSSEKSETK